MSQLAIERGQVSKSAAEVYEEFFVPALFQQWAVRVADAARIRPGDKVLDVACGTGVLTRELVGRVGPAGSVMGIDINDGMLSVARRKLLPIEWRQAPAEDLPLPSGSFDAVLSQFGLMFFQDRRAALKEVWRVLRPGGHLAVAVWDRLEHSPGYAAMADLLLRLFGKQAADALRAPFILGDPQELKTLFAEAGIPDARVTTHDERVCYPSIESWVYMDIKGWTLAEMIDDEQYSQLLEEASRSLGRFVGAEGVVSFNTPAHVVAATKS